MNTKQRKTLRAIFARPTSSSIVFADREALVIALGGEVHERDNIFVGRVLGLHAMISFHGETVAELRANFEAAIEDFLRDCKEQGIAPEKPASGKRMLRVPPEVHGAALVAAQASGKNLNQWATEVLKSAAHA